MNSLSLVEKIACLSSQDKVYLENLVDRFLVTPQRKGCDCHVIDPKKQDMIIWPSQNPKHPNDLIVQFTNQKFIGMPRVDKNGNKYWKVRSFYEDESNNEPKTNPSASPKLNLKEEIKAIQNKPLNEQTAEDREKWAEFVASQENIPNQGENHAPN